MKDMLSLSQSRFSARKFTSEAVSQEDLDYIMQCVQLAPSAVNRQPWLWLIVRSAEAKEKLQECYDRRKRIVGMMHDDSVAADGGEHVLVVVMIQASRRCRDKGGIFQIVTIDRRQSHQVAET